MEGRGRLVARVASQVERRGKYEEQHLAESGRDGCRAPESHISIMLRLLGLPNLPSRRHTRARVLQADLLEVLIRHPWMA